MKISLTTEYPSQDKTEQVSFQYIYCSKIFRSQEGINIPDIFLSRKIRFWHEIRILISPVCPCIISDFVLKSAKYLKQANQQENVLGLVPRKMVKFNPGLSQVLSKVLCKNM